MARARPGAAGKLPAAVGGVLAAVGAVAVPGEATGTAASGMIREIQAKVKYALYLHT